MHITHFTQFQHFTQFTQWTSDPKLPKLRNITQILCTNYAQIIHVMHVVEVGESVRRKPFRSSSLCPVMYPSRAWLTKRLGSVKSGLDKSRLPFTPPKFWNTAFIGAINDFFSSDHVFLYLPPFLLHIIRWHFSTSIGENFCIMCVISALFVCNLCVICALFV